MISVVEVLRPFQKTVFEPLMEECDLTVKGHVFWCASSPIRRIVESLMNASTPIDDVVWVCNILNSRAISEALSMPHRANRMEAYRLEGILGELMRQQADIDANPELGELLDDPSRLKERIASVREQIKRVQK